MKKVVYNTGEFKIDALAKVLEDMYGKLTPEDKERMEKESQQRKAEYDRTWYDTPREDLYIGYECEIQTSWGYVKGTWPKILKADTHVTLLGAGATLRSRYLTQSDIEACEWKWDGDKDYGQKFYKEVDGKYYILYTERGDTNVTISEYKKGRNPEYLTKFDGECKSINELRTLMRWLKINNNEEQQQKDK